MLPDMAQQLGGADRRSALLAASQAICATGGDLSLDEVEDGVQQLAEAFLEWLEDDGTAEAST